MPELTQAPARRRPQTSVDYVYHSMRDAIVRGVLAAGARIPLNDWALELGTSVTPVREALRRLQTEGLVDFAPHRGATVVGLSAPAGLEIYEMRVLVEPRLMQQAVDAFDAERERRALELCDRMDEAATSSVFAELNEEFHALMLDVPPSWTSRVVDMLRTASAAYVASSLEGDRTRTRASNEEHRELVAAFAAGDVARAQQLTVDHLESTRQILADQTAALDDEPAERAPRPAR